ncbi:MAG: IscS subfamily cysteine desulfurase [Candidatus Marinimicrobia bacterium]|nr:IscS subfamily cysteine desulfurase [Candidatus Neomarinimicrobiota bacterium]MBL7022818.1 IscS subfamily cysteine desulfurase [Candidatus Neomarinimicrobiota bacterium]MBL7109461.1 IscS subfamily cysteine desulfurase [Candidatus Neomarinimicrobiota bacterium]
MKKIYLDYHSTTPVDPIVLDEMLPYFSEKFGNAASRNHAYGWEAEEAVDIAREKIADLICATSREIIFTSGATESNNLAIKGIAQMFREKGNHIITVKTEHKAVLDTCKALERDGFDVTYLPVEKNGLLNLDKLKSAITNKTILISVMHANNEIGVIQPVTEIGEICKEHGVFFHCDAAQSIGKIPIDVNEMGIDLLSISGHKIYGPKGIGALYVRRKNPRVRLKSQIDGGGHERGMRSGTLPTPIIVGLGKSCELAGKLLEEENTRLKSLRDKLYKGISSQLPQIILNGDTTNRLPGNLNLSFAYVEGESLIMSLPNIALSSGSACTSASLEPSYVIKALGVSEDLAHSSIRFGLGRFTTEEEIDVTIESVVKAVNRLREMSPLWEMAQEGIDLNSVKWSE